MEIEEDFKKRFVVTWGDVSNGKNNEHEVDTFKAIVEPYSILAFFKPYFQEQRHEISLRELEEEHPLYKKEYNELPEIVDNSR